MMYDNPKFNMEKCIRDFCNGTIELMDYNEKECSYYFFPTKLNYNYKTHKFYLAQRYMFNKDSLYRDVFSRILRNQTSEPNSLTL